MQPLQAGHSPSRSVGGMDKMKSQPSVMQMARQAVPLARSLVRSSMLAMSFASHTLKNFVPLLVRTIVDIVFPSLPGPEEFGCWLARSDAHLRAILSSTRRGE